MSHGGLKRSEIMSPLNEILVRRPLQEMMNHSNEGDDESFQILYLDWLVAGHGGCLGSRGTCGCKKTTESVQGYLAHKKQRPPRTLQ